MSEAAASNASSSAKAVRKKRGFFGKLRLLFLGLVLLLTIAAHPSVFPSIVRSMISIEAWRKGATVQVGEIEGSLFDAVVLHDTTWTMDSETGASTVITAAQTRAWFAWNNIFPEPVSRWLGQVSPAFGIEPIGKNSAWFQRLELQGVTANLTLPYSGEAEEPAAAGQRWLHAQLDGGLVHAPVYVSVHHAQATITRHGEQLTFQDARLTMSELEPGVFRCAQLAVKSPWFSKTFRDVRGRTALEDSKATVARLVLSPEVKVETFSVGLAALPAGKVSFTTELTAFGGTMRAEAEAAPRQRQINIEASGSFSKIQIGGLASFLGLSEAAGGLVKEGNFTFRGNPRQSAHGELYLRVAADNFQWETRQWDSLVLGVSLREGRLEIPSLNLRQGDNQLNLTGSMALPQAAMPWWQRQFDFKVDGDIRNLTTLSALVLPDFKYAAGQLFVRGTVSGTGAEAGKLPEFDGQLIVSGSGLTWRTAPLDVLHAALLFHGNELQIINAQFLHGDDFLRGNGTVNLLGDPNYRGEIRAGVADLAVYRAILDPFLPMSLAGGGNFEWSGEGSGKGHEGKFNGTLRSFRMLGSNAAHPLNAEMAGSYGKEHMEFSKFTLSDTATSLTANVGIGSKALHLQGIRLEHGGQLWLEGDAFLPLDVWQQWPNVSLMDLLNDETVTHVALTAHNLQLRETGMLSGFEWPVDGLINGTFSAEGTTTALKLGGKVTLTKGRLPLSPYDVAGGVEAEVTGDAAQITLTKCTGWSVGGDFTLGGTLNLADLRAPILTLSGAANSAKESTFIEFNAAPGVKTPPAPAAPAAPAAKEGAGSTTLSPKKTGAS